MKDEEGRRKEGGRREEGTKRSERGDKKVEKVVTGVCAFALFRFCSVCPLFFLFFCILLMLGDLQRVIAKELGRMWDPTLRREMRTKSSEHKQQTKKDLISECSQPGFQSKRCRTPGALEFF